MINERFTTYFRGAYFEDKDAEFEDFLRAIRENGTPICNGREGRRSIALVEAIYEAARTGSSVSVSRQKL